MKAGILAGTLAAGMGLAACAPEAEVSGRSDYMTLCAGCHGPEARGGVANGLGKVPADLTRIAARNGGVFDYAAVMSRIDGYTRDDSGQVMPDFGALLEGDTVMVDVGDGRLTPTPARLFGLAQYLASIQEVEPRP